MARRTNIRIPIRIKVRFFCENRVHTGFVSNISDKGMFIITSEICIPEKSQFNLAIPLEDEILHVPVIVNRIVNMESDVHGIGVEIIDPPKIYLDYVDNLLFLL